MAHVGKPTSVCLSSLKFDGIVGELMEDNVLHFFHHRLICSINLEITVTCTHGHFNQVVFVVWQICMYPQYWQVAHDTKALES